MTTLPRGAPRPDTGMRLVYTFAGKDVEIASVTSIPVSSIRREMELGTCRRTVRLPADGCQVVTAFFED